MELTHWLIPYPIDRWRLRSVTPLLGAWRHRSCLSTPWCQSSGFEAVFSEVKPDVISPCIFVHFSECQERIFDHAREEQIAENCTEFTKCLAVQTLHDKANFRCWLITLRAGGCKMAGSAPGAAVCCRLEEVSLFSQRWPLSIRSKFFRRSSEPRPASPSLPPPPLFFFFFFFFGFPLPS